MRVISQWKFDGDVWGIALLCVFGGRFTYGIVICGYVFEWDRKLVAAFKPPLGQKQP